MALIGTLSEIASVLAHAPRFTEALAYAQRCFTPESVESKRLMAMPLFKVEKVVLPDGSPAIEQSYLTRPRTECFFESHLLHIDVQCMVSGEEWIDLISIRNLVISEPFREDKDLIKYGDSPLGSRLRLRSGLVAVFFPEDGHMPGQRIEQALPVHKTVIKVPVKARV